MNKALPLSGRLGQWDLAAILFQMHVQDAHGMLRIQAGGFSKGIVVEGQKVICALSADPQESFPAFLERRHLIEPEMKARLAGPGGGGFASQARAILEGGALDADALWQAAGECTAEIVQPLFILTDGGFEIVTLEALPAEAPVGLERPIPLFLLESIRRIADERFIYGRFQNREELFVSTPQAAAGYPLKPYEIHLLELVRRHSTLGEILKNSPLLPLQTLKILYFFFSVGILACKEEAPPPQRVAAEMHWMPSFSCYDEALAYFNSRYEYIFRLLSKEIGPVAASILSDSVAAILDRLPAYLSEIHFDESGKMDEKPLLKALRFLNFEQTVAGLLTGLEEILYAEIYAIKKHLGKEYEQLILQWMRETGVK